MFKGLAIDSKPDIDWEVHPVLRLDLNMNTYDGYHFHQSGAGMYNPFSVLNTFINNEFGSYWFETGTPTYLVTLHQKHSYRLQD